MDSMDIMVQLKSHRYNIDLVYFWTIALLDLTCLILIYLRVFVHWR